MDAISARTNIVGSLDAPPLLDVAGLSKRYGDQMALADISFDVRSGEILGLIGPNGAGKTSLLEAIAGVIPVDTGCVHWQGSFLPSSRRRERMFFLPDGLRPWEDQYVGRVIEFIASVYRTKETGVARTVATLGLSPVLGKRVFALSK